MLELLPNLPHDLLLLYISAAVANFGISSSEEWLSQATLALSSWPLTDFTTLWWKGPLRSHSQACSLKQDIC